MQLGGLIMTSNGMSTQAKTKVVAKHSGIEELEAAMLNFPDKMEAPIYHFHGPGVYIREMHIPKGALILGHEHKHDHLCVMLRGKLALLSKTAPPEIIEGPYMFVASSGRKLAFALKDTVFQNIHPTDSTNLKEIEKQFITKSDTFLEYEQLQASITEGD